MSLLHMTWIELPAASCINWLLKKSLRNGGSILEHVLGQYPDNEDGRFQKQLRAALAELEKAKIIERNKRGKAQSGYVNVGSHPPFGYGVRSEPHKTWLEIDLQEAETVL